MLLLSKPMGEFEGVVVYADHADPDLFWAMPGHVDLLKRRSDGRPSFSFIKYKPAVAGAGIKGGGFAAFDVALALDDQLKQRIESRLSAVSDNPRISLVPYKTGSVQCMALNLQGAGGASAEPAPAGAFNAVEDIQGATIPSLQGDNVATFGLTLSQEGAIILEQAFENGLSPIGVLYNLKFNAMQPALHVKITADLERCYTQFSASLEGQYYFVRAGIDAAFEKLKQTGAIKIEVTDFTGEEDQKEQEKWALDFFKEQLLEDWFEPTLTPGEIAGGAAEAEGLDAVIARSQTLIENAANNARRGAQGGNQGGGPNPGGTTPETPPTEPSEHPQASFTVTGRNPDPTPDGKGISHTPSTSGNNEVLVVQGEGAQVSIDGVAQALGADGRISVNVPPGQSRQVEVVYPGQMNIEVFDLFFNKDKPEEEGFSTSPPSSSFLAYVNNSTSDTRFKGASELRGADQQPSGQGAERLENWVRNNLSGSRSVEIEAFASFEDDDSVSQQQRNMRLSDRRSKVAEAIVRRAGGRIARRVFSGHEVARNEGRSDDPIDRKAVITGTASSDPEVRITGTISRPAVETPQRPTPPPNNGGTPTPTPPPSVPTMATTPAAVSLKLKFVRQEERKKLTVVYDRQQAVERTFAPQGLFGLMLDDIEKDEHFTEVDLDAAFFRELNIEASAPVDFEAIDLVSAQVAIDYGNPTIPGDVKHRELSFRVGDSEEPKTAAFFLNRDLDLSYRLGLTYNFRGGSDWEGEQLQYVLPVEVTEDRSLHVDPHLQLGFKTVRIYPHRIDADMVDKIVVSLRYEDPSGWIATKSMTVRPGDEETVWKIRQSARNAPFAFTYKLVHHLHDGGRIEANTVSTDLPELAVSDPFPHAIELFIVPALDPDQTRVVTVEIEYDPADGSPLRRKRIEVPGTQLSTIVERISITDQNQRSFRVRQTVIGKDLSIKVTPWEERTDTQIIVTG